MTIVGEPSRSIIGGQWAMRIIRRVSNAQGDFAGMVAGTILLGDFESYFGRVRPAWRSSHPRMTRILRFIPSPR